MTKKTKKILSSLTGLAAVGSAVAIPLATTTACSVYVAKAEWSGDTNDNGDVLISAYSRFIGLTGLDAEKQGTEPGIRQIQKLQIVGDEWQSKTKDDYFNGIRNDSTNSETDYIKSDIFMEIYRTLQNPSVVNYVSGMYTVTAQDIATSVQTNSSLINILAYDYNEKNINYMSSIKFYIDLSATTRIDLTVSYNVMNAESEVINADSPTNSFVITSRNSDGIVFSIRREVKELGLDGKWSSNGFDINYNYRTTTLINPFDPHSMYFNKYPALLW